MIPMGVLPILNENRRGVDWGVLEGKWEMGGEKGGKLWSEYKINKFNLKKNTGSKRVYMVIGDWVVILCHPQNWLHQKSLVLV